MTRKNKHGEAESGNRVRKREERWKWERRARRRRGGEGGVGHTGRNARDGKTRKDSQKTQPGAAPGLCPVIAAQMLLEENLTLLSSASKTHHTPCGCFSLEGKRENKKKRRLLADPLVLFCCGSSIRLRVFCCFKTARCLPAGLSPASTGFCCSCFQDRRLRPPT